MPYVYKLYKRCDLCKVHAPAGESMLGHVFEERSRWDTTRDAAKKGVV